jgi:hypothetical protein
MPAWTKERCDYPKSSEKPLGVPDGLACGVLGRGWADEKELLGACLLRINRALKLLQERDLVRIERVDITILDRERLRSVKE